MHRFVRGLMVVCGAGRTRRTRTARLIAAVTVFMRRMSLVGVAGFLALRMRFGIAGFALRLFAALAGTAFAAGGLALARGLAGFGLRRVGLERYHDATIGLVALGVRLYIGMILQRRVQHAPLVRIHRLKHDFAAGFDGARRHALGQPR